MPVDLAKEAEGLAQTFYSLSDAVDDFWQRQYGALSPAQVQQLKNEAQALARRGHEFSADALGAILHELLPRLSNIKKATEDAKDALAHLDDVAKALAIVDSAVALVTSLATGDLPSIGDKVDGLAQAITS